MIVDAVQRVEVQAPTRGHKVLVGDDRPLVVLDHPVVVAQQDVDVRGHVDQVAGVGDELPELVGRLERVVGMPRHLHEMDVEMQETRVGHATWTSQRGVQDFLGLDRARTFRWGAGPQIPQRPWADVHQGIRVQRGDIEVVGVGAVHVAHRARVAVVP